LPSTFSTISPSLRAPLRRSSELVDSRAMRWPFSVELKFCRHHVRAPRTRLWCTAPCPTDFAVFCGSLGEFALERPAFHRISLRRGGCSRLFRLAGHVAPPPHPYPVPIRAYNAQILAPSSFETSNDISIVGYSPTAGICSPICVKPRRVGSTPPFLPMLSPLPWGSRC